MVNDPSLIHGSFPSQGEEIKAYQRSSTGSDQIYGSPKSGYDLSKDYYTPGEPTKYREDSISNEKASFDKKVRS